MAADDFGGPEKQLPRRRVAGTHRLQVDVDRTTAHHFRALQVPAAHADGQHACPPVGKHAGRRLQHLVFQQTAAHGP